MIKIISVCGTIFFTCYFAAVAWFFSFPILIYALSGLLLGLSVGSNLSNAGNIYKIILSVVIVYIPAIVLLAVYSTFFIANPVWVLAAFISIATLNWFIENIRSFTNKALGFFLFLANFLIGVCAIPVLLTAGALCLVGAAAIFIVVASLCLSVVVLSFALSPICVNLFMFFEGSDFNNPGVLKIIASVLLSVVISYILTSLVWFNFSSLLTEMTIQGVLQGMLLGWQNPYVIGLSVVVFLIVILSIYSFNYGDGNKEHLFLGSRIALSLKESLVCVLGFVDIFNLRFLVFGLSEKQIEGTKAILRVLPDLLGHDVHTLFVHSFEREELKCVGNRYGHLFLTRNNEGFATVNPKLYEKPLLPPPQLYEKPLLPPPSYDDSYDQPPPTYDDSVNNDCFAFKDHFVLIDGVCLSVDDQKIPFNVDSSIDAPVVSSSDMTSYKSQIKSYNKIYYAFALLSLVTGYLFATYFSAPFIASIVLNLVVSQVLAESVAKLSLNKIKGWHAWIVATFITVALGVLNSYAVINISPIIMLGIFVLMLLSVNSIKSDLGWRESFYNQVWLKRLKLFVFTLLGYVICVLVLAVGAVVLAAGTVVLGLGLVVGVIALACVIIYNCLSKILFFLVNDCVVIYRFFYEKRRLFAFVPLFVTPLLYIGTAIVYDSLLIMNLSIKNAIILNLTNPYVWCITIFLMLTLTGIINYDDPNESILSMLFSGVNKALELLFNVFVVPIVMMLVVIPVVDYLAYILLQMISCVLFSVKTDRGGARFNNLSESMRENPVQRTIPIMFQEISESTLAEDDFKITLRDRF